MSLNTYCTRCSRPLLVESASGLCPDCLRTANSPGSTSKDLPPVDPIVDPHASTASALPPASRTGSYGTPVESQTASELPPADKVPMPPAPPGFEILRELGIGGMGAVFLAREVVSERLVAIKFLQRPGHQGAFDRFGVEVKALGALDHPNIIRFYSSDFFRSNPYFTTEYAAGGCLLKKLEAKGPFDPKDAARLMAIVARAIHAAHSAKVIHRDLKPSNIVLMADGLPKVSDFGLAKRIDRNDDLTTGTGPLGSPPYMAPEQTGREEGDLDERTDVYGLGATLYHLVTGRRPFTGLADEVIQQVKNDLPIPPRAVRRDIPRELEAIILKCLEKNPAKRYQSAQALATDLDKFLVGDKDIDAPLLTWPRRAGQWVRRNRKRVAVIGLLGVFAIGLMVVIAAAPWRDPLLSPDQVRRKLQSGDLVTLVGPDKVLVKTEWGLGPCELTRSPSRDTRCSFQTRESAILTLITDPGVVSFRIRAELRQDMKLSDADGVSVDTGKVGLAIGHSRTPFAEGAGVHALWLVGFCEYPAPLPNPAPDRRITLYDLALFEQPLLGLWHQQIHGPNVRLRPPVDDPRPWRTIEVDVGPNGVVVRHAGLEATDLAGNLNRRRGDLEAKVRTGWAREAPAALPRWDTPLAIGIFASSSWVSARNVTIEPLP